MLTSSCKNTITLFAIVALALAMVGVVVAGAENNPVNTTTITTTTTTTPPTNPVITTTSAAMNASGTNNSSAPPSSSAAVTPSELVHIQNITETLTKHVLSHTKRLAKLERRISPRWASQSIACPDGWTNEGYIWQVKRVRCVPPAVSSSASLSSSPSHDSTKNIRKNSSSSQPTMFSGAPINPHCQAPAYFPRVFDRCEWSWACGAEWKMYGCVHITLPQVISIRIAPIISSQKMLIHTNLGVDPLTPAQTAALLYQQQQQQNTGSNLVFPLSGSTQSAKISAVTVSATSSTPASVSLSSSTNQQNQQQQQQQRPHQHQTAHSIVQVALNPTSTGKLASDAWTMTHINTANHLAHKAAHHSRHQQQRAASNPTADFLHRRNVLKHGIAKLEHALEQ